MPDMNVAEGTAAPVQPGQQTNAEQMVPQSRVNEIVSGARLDGEARARQMVEQQASKIAELEQQIAQINQSMQGGGGQQQQTAPNSVSPPANDMSAVVKQEMAALQQRQLRAEQARQVDELLRHFDGEMKRGSGHDDFQKVTGKFNTDAFPEITIMAAQLDNTPEVMYELMKNTTKLGSISELARRDGNLAFAELKDLSDSLKENANAKANHVSPIKPLGGVKASTAGTDNGKRTVTDWKAFYRNKR